MSAKGQCYTTLTLLLALSMAQAVLAIDQKTGTATWSTPLSTLKGTSVSLPVALSHASAAKRDDLATWVGNGWRLDMPYIERIVSGGPDDAENSTRRCTPKVMSRETSAVCPCSAPSPVTTTLTA